MLNTRSTQSNLKIWKQVICQQHPRLVLRGGKRILTQLHFRQYIRFKSQRTFISHSMACNISVKSVSVNKLDIAVLPKICAIAQDLKSIHYQWLISWLTKRWHISIVHFEEIKKTSWLFANYYSLITVPPWETICLQNNWLTKPCLLLSLIKKALQCVAISHWSRGFLTNDDYWNISLKAEVSLYLIGRVKVAEFQHNIDRRRYLVRL